MNEKLVKKFTEKAEAVSAEVIRVGTCQQAYEEIIKLIKEGSIKKVGCTPSGMAAGLLPHLKQQGVEAVTEASPQEAAELEVGIIPVQVGIAETGTVAHDATDLFSRFFSMLCSFNIVLLPTAAIAENMLQAINMLAKEGIPPSYSAFITGPSRTADIERVLTIGVHGPGRLYIVLVDGEGC